MTVPRIVTPAAILRVFIIFLLKRLALSRVVSVSGEVSASGEGEDGIDWCDPSSPEK